MKAMPLTISKANAFIEAEHRHHGKVRGHRFSIGALNEHECMVGVVVVGRPVSSKTDQTWVCEVTRLATDGTQNCCSFLYASAARAAKAMGFKSIQTFILESETGASLRGAGWIRQGITQPSGFHRRNADSLTRLTDNRGLKAKWTLQLNE
jgi:hypothetical protein